MKKLFGVFVMGVMLLGLMPGAKEAAGYVAPNTEPQVNVKLINYLGNQSSINLKFSGNYSITGSTTILTGNKTYTIKAENGNLGLYDGTSKLFSANTLSISPVNGNSSFTWINTRQYQGSFTFNVENNQYVRPVNTLGLEDYLKSVVPSEMYGSWQKEALKAQAVAARTVAYHRLNSGLDDTTYKQAYAGTSTLYPNSSAAVDETAGEILTYKGDPIDALFSASNGGMTENNYNEYGTTALPYFPVQKDSYDGYDSSFYQVTWSFSIYKQQIDTTKLNLSNPDSWWDTTQEADKNTTDNIKAWLYSKRYATEPVKIISIPKLAFYNQIGDKSGRVSHGEISFQYFVKGDVDPASGKPILHTLDINAIADTIRSIIGQMPSTLLSPLPIAEDDDSYTISGKGNGHGVGMSQYGAENRAIAGLNYRSILSFYYPGTDITNPFFTKGWVKQGSNSFYIDNTGKPTVGWLNLNGKKYYFDNNGVMKTGWIKLGSTWYDFAANGVMLTGWVKSGPTWYYLDVNGAMKTGWIKSGNIWYYLDAGGAMKTGWIKSGTAWYYLDASGAMKTGWVKVGSAWYYFYSSGAMACNTTIQGHRLNASGAMIK